MTKAQDNVKNYIDKITKDDPILKEEYLGGGE
jgi:hypothetical protein